MLAPTAAPKGLFHLIWEKGKTTTGFSHPSLHLFIAFFPLSSRSSPDPSSVRVVPGMLHDDLQRQPGLLGGGNDLSGGQQESVEPRIPQLEGEGIFNPLVVGPVDGRSTRSV